MSRLKENHQNFITKKLNEHTRKIDLHDQIIFYDKRRKNVFDQIRVEVEELSVKVDKSVAKIDAEM